MFDIQALVCWTQGESDSASLAKNCGRTVCSWSYKSKIQPSSFL